MLAKFKHLETLKIAIRYFADLDGVRFAARDLVMRFADICPSLREVVFTIRHEFHFSQPIRHLAFSTTCGTESGAFREAMWIDT